MGGRLVSPSDREALIRAAFLGVAAELAEMGTSKSGSVTIHFQNGLPTKNEWRLLARSITFSRTEGVLHSEDERL